MRTRERKDLRFCIGCGVGITTRSKTGRCPPCCGSAHQAKRTVDERSATQRAVMAQVEAPERSERGRRANARLSPEERTARSKKSYKTSTGDGERKHPSVPTTPEGRREKATRGLATMGADGLRARAAKSLETLGPAGRSERARRANASMTPEERRDRALKLWDRLSPEQQRRAMAAWKAKSKRGPTPGGGRK